MMPRRSQRLGLPLLFVVLLGLAPAAMAHKASDAYLSLADAPLVESPTGRISLRLSLALKDLDAALDTLDADDDRRLTWGEVRRATTAIAAWAGAGTVLRCGGALLSAAWRLDALERRSDGSYIRLAAALDCPPEAALTLDYRLMKEIDPTHRLLVAGQLNSQAIAAVLAPQGRSHLELRPGQAASASRTDAIARPDPVFTSTSTSTSALTSMPAPQPADVTPASPNSGTSFSSFFVEGVRHILTGYDHLAFLLALLLPLSLARRAPARALATLPLMAQPPREINSAEQRGLAALMLTVTGFTVGHSITLALASLGWISASGAWVEPAIAISIAVTAALNLHPVRGLPAPALAATFGLVHGLGFSTVVIEAGLSGAPLVGALVGFNLGVEAGQLAMVALWCALHVLLVRWSLYPLAVVRGGSVALLALALFWTAERLTA